MKKLFFTLGAMALGLIAVHAQKPAVVVNDKTGWLIRDSEPETIVEVMKASLFLDKSVLRSKKEAALLQVKGFTWEKNIHKLLHTLHSSSH